MKDELVSVIIPVYNVEKYLRECLDSVLAQTYESYEVIMVDDGSSDSSGDICDAYEEKEAGFRVIHRENGGLSTARNTGLEEAKGKYVYFLDSDDWIEKEALSALVRKAEETGADFVYFDGRSFEDSEKGYNVPQGYVRKREYQPDSGMNAFDALQKNKDFKAAVQSYFWKKDFLDSHELRFYPGILYEDLLFSFEAFCKAGMTAHCHEGFFQRRLRPGSIMSSRPVKRNFQSMITVYEEVCRIASEHGCADKESVRQYIARCAMRCIEIYGRLSAPDQRDCKAEYKYIIEKIRKAGGYGVKPLYYRTYGKLPWAANKAFEKIRRR